MHANVTEVCTEDISFAYSVILNSGIKNLLSRVSAFSSLYAYIQVCKHASAFFSALSIFVIEVKDFWKCEICYTLKEELIMV